MARLRGLTATALLLAALLGRGCTCESALHDRGGLPGAAPFDDGLAARLAAALAARGPDYRPHTRHLDGHGKPIFTNRLILEHSPYLVMHAHNPVNWYAWGDEAFETARREQRPILLSIGYATCHWCHVMEEESFEDLETARVLNTGYVAIKVDRELRPDLDQIYEEAVQRMGGGGGWPLTVWLTPDRQPFFGGTFFPGETGPRGQSFREVLAGLRDSYHKDGPALAAQAARTWAGLAAGSLGGKGAGAAGPATLRAAAAHLAQRFDPEWGGFGRGTKFPEPTNLELLLHIHRRTGDAQALTMVTVTLDAILSGGIYDQLGGGFHRYATDQRWLVPHFEKMLYDNAQLVVVYLEAFQVTGKGDYARVARATLDWMDREMAADGGGFYGATDADSPGGEGSYFVWKPGQVDAVLGAARGPLARAWFGVGEPGNFQDGASTLTRRRALSDLAAGRDAAAVAAELEAARGQLLTARAQRPAPPIDRKVIVAWNGLAVSAFARGAEVLGDRRYREIAERTAGALLARAQPAGALAHALVDGVPVGQGFLDDYAILTAGLLDLYEVDADPRWLREAIRLQKAVDDGFSDPAGGYRFTSAAHEQLLAHALPTYDGVIPAGGSVAARNLLRLAVLTGDETLRKRADGVFASYGALLARAPEAMPALLAALDYALDEPKQLVIVTPPGHADAAADLLARAHQIYLPNRVVAVAGEDAVPGLSGLLPLLADKTAEGGATAYVCEATHCELPTGDPATLERLLRQVTPLPE